MTSAPHRSPLVTGYKPRCSSETKTRKQVSSAAVEVEDEAQRSVTPKSHTTNLPPSEGQIQDSAQVESILSTMTAGFFSSLPGVLGNEKVPDLYLRSELYANGGNVLVLMAKVSLPSTPESKLKNTAVVTILFTAVSGTLSVDST